MQVNKQNARKAAKTLTPAVNALLMTTATAQLERERVDAIYRAVLAKAPGYKDDKGQIITEPRNAWHIADKTELSIYHAECEEAIRAAGYNVPAGYCPALMAEEAQRQAQHLLIEAAREFFPDVTVNALLCHKNGLETLRKYIDLLIGLVVNAPGYRKAAA